MTKKMASDALRPLSEEDKLSLVKAYVARTSKDILDGLDTSTKDKLITETCDEILGMDYEYLEKIIKEEVKRKDKSDL